MLLSGFRGARNAPLSFLGRGRGRRIGSAPFVTAGAVGVEAGAEAAGGSPFIASVVWWCGNMVRICCAWRWMEGSLCEPVVGFVGQ
jgi:hypothetical protein